MLGVGLDTRAFRIALPAHLRWFEIDRAEIFEQKEPVLPELGAETRCQRSVLVADLSGAWSPSLLDAGFRAGSEPHGSPRACSSSSPERSRVPGERRPTYPHSASLVRRCRYGDACLTYSRTSLNLAVAAPTTESPAP